MTSLKHVRVRVQAGFTLIELMIVVAIIGILAAIAIPAYQDYITRAKITELVIAADACKTTVSEYYQSNNAFPTAAQAACTNSTSKYVTSLVVTDGTGQITVTGATGTGALPAAAAGTFNLRPTVQTNGNLDWSCTNAGAGTTIPVKYLPSNCR